MNHQRCILFMLLIYLLGAITTPIHGRSKKIKSTVFYRYIGILLKSIQDINALLHNYSKNTLTATISGDLTVTGTIKNNKILNVEIPSEAGFRMLIGTINTTNSTISSGAGFTIEKVDTGTIQIIFNTPFKANSIPTVLLSTNDSNNTIRTVGLPNNETIVVTRVNDGIFQFIVIGENA